MCDRYDQDKGDYTWRDDELHRKREEGKHQQITISIDNPQL